MASVHSQQCPGKSTRRDNYYLPSPPAPGRGCTRLANHSRRDLHLGTRARTPGRSLTAAVGGSEVQEEGGARGVRGGGGAGGRTHRCAAATLTLETSGARLSGPASFAFNTSTHSAPGVLLHQPATGQVGSTPPPLPVWHHPTPHCSRARVG